MAKRKGKTRKLSKTKIEKAHKLGKALKGKPGIKSPYGLATYMVKKKKKKKGKK